MEHRISHLLLIVALLHGSAAVAQVGAGPQITPNGMAPAAAPGTPPPPDPSPPGQPVYAPPPSSSTWPPASQPASQTTAPYVPSPYVPSDGSVLPPPNQPYVPSDQTVYPPPGTYMAPPAQPVYVAPAPWLGRAQPWPRAYSRCVQSTLGHQRRCAVADARCGKRRALGSFGLQRLRARPAGVSARPPLVRRRLIPVDARRAVSTGRPNQRSDGS